MKEISAKEAELEERIDACEKRIAKMVKTKYELGESLRIHLRISNDEATEKRYFELYDHMDDVIAEDAKSLAALVQERSQVQK